MPCDDALNAPSGRAFEQDLEALGCSLPPDAELLAEGWEYRFLADPRMAAEAVATYRELGYEVRLEPFEVAAAPDECSGCRLLLQQFKRVYVRKK